MNSMRKTLRRNTVYGATIIALLVMAVGFVTATVLTNVAVSQNVNSYTGGTSSTVDFPTTPTLTISQVGNPTAVVSTITVSAGTGSTLKFAMCAPSGCTLAATDFDEVFTFTSAASVTAGASNTFTVTTTFGTGPTTTQATLTYTAGGTQTSADTVEIFIDYGIGTPSGGISTLDVVVTGT